MTESNKAEEKKAVGAKKAADKASKDAETQGNIEETLKGLEARLVAAEQAAEEAQARAEAAEEATVASGAPVPEAKKEKVKLRVFRIKMSQNKEARNTGIVTLMTEKSVINGVPIPAKIKRLAPNHASQYVLQATAIEYQKQLQALRKIEAKGSIIEVDAKYLGIPYISEEQKALAEYEKKAAELRKELGIPEKK